jgi:hypothetical protein
VGEYDGITAKAAALLVKKGAPATLERYTDDETGTPADPLAVAQAAGSPGEQTFNFVKVPTTSGEPGEELGFISPLELTGSFEVLGGDIVVVSPDTADEERWQIVRVQAIAPIGRAANIIWKVWVKLWPAMKE